MKALDLTGQRFGKLTVLKRTETRSKRRGRRPGVRMWLCQCDCGNTVYSESSNLRSGDQASCGCAHDKHGDHKSRLYQTWASMKNRCSSANNDSYGRYGGRGITVCNEWAHYPPFREWALSNGYAGNLQIDRIDNNGNYEPSNCRWVTPAKNTRNRNCVILSEQDVVEIRHLLFNYNMTIEAISQKYGVGRTIISNIKNNKKWLGVDGNAQETSAAI